MSNSTESTESTVAHVPASTLIWCPNRLYMNKGFLSNHKKCNCEWEVEDLFAGSSGVMFNGFFCTFDPSCMQQTDKEGISQ